MKKTITHGSTFSGIGAPEIAAEMLGWENVFHCEINEFGRRVLDYHYPNSKSYEDITKTDFSEWRGKVTVLTGGFPCQPFSYAGKRRGSEDDRYLWPFMLKCIEQVKPAWFVGENVAGIATMAFPGEDVKVGERSYIFGESDGVGVYERRERYILNEIIENLERVGYEVQTFLVPACAVGAPHRRDRVFIVAHLAESATDTDRHSDESGNAGEYEDEGGEKQLQERNEVQWPVESDRLRREMDATSECTFGFGLEERDDFQGGLGELQKGRSSDEAFAPACGDVFQGSSPDTDSTRQSAPDKQNRREWEKMDGRSESKPFDGSCGQGFYGSSADTESVRHRGVVGEECGAEERQVQQDKRQRREVGSETQGCCGRVSADTEGLGGICGSRPSGREGQEALGSERDTDGLGGSRSSADTDGGRLARYGDNAEQREQGHTGQPAETGIKGCDGCQQWATHPRAKGGDCGQRFGDGMLPENRWTGFPSQSPVYRRGDGVPFGVDTSAISPGKWVKEAIKAYGNAIVPQVMYEIFRCIDIIENEDKQDL